MRFRDVRALLLVLLLAAASGCATAGQGGSAPIALVINNNLIPPTSLTVHLVSSRGGSRQLLGSVSSGERRTLSYRGPTPIGEYRLVAQAPGRGVVASQPFILADAAGLVWELAQNVIRYEGGSR